MKLLKIGKLAKESGVTVRTLRHYHDLGLLNPQYVDESGHRFYGLKEVERLQQIITLKKIGLSLEEISRILSGDVLDLGEGLRLQQESLDQKIQDLKKVSQLVLLMQEKMSKEENLEMEELLTFIKEVMDMEKYYTPEQIKKLQERLSKYPKEVKEVEREWPLLFEEFEKALKKGLSVEDASVQKLAAKAQHFIDLFTGGDIEIEKNLDKAYEDNQQNALKTWNVSKEVFDYANEARMFLKKKK